MEINIFENGCKDPELMVLDTKLSYFLNSMSKCSSLNGVEVHIVRSLDDFKKMTGEELNGQCSKFCDNKVFILEPSKFSKTHHARDEFYDVLYKQLFTLMYKHRK